MKYLIGIFVAVLAASATLIPPVKLAVFAAADKIPVLLAVLLAAVLVRLARGLPTLPFDKINASQALGATNAFRLLLRSYSQSLGTITFAIALNLFVAPFLDANPIDRVSSAYAFILMFSDILCIIVVYFLVSADLKISHMQADLTDQITGASSSEAASKSIDTVKEAFASKDRPTPSVTQL